MLVLVPNLPLVGSPNNDIITARALWSLRLLGLGRGAGRTLHAGGGQGPRQSRGERDLSSGLQQTLWDAKENNFDLHEFFKGRVLRQMF